MPIYDFQFDFSLTPRVRGLESPAQYPIAGQQLSHAQGAEVSITTGKQGRVDPLGRLTGVASEDIEDFVIPGFRSLDESMKMYWSDIRVLTRDAYRFLRVKVAGLDKSVSIWRDDLVNGRARLPVASLSRTKASFNKDKFSPAYHPMAIQLVNRRANLAALVYRPVPFLVEYTLTVLAEHKRDAEVAAYQIHTRFNPLAEFVMCDGHLRGVLTIRFGGSSDQSDKEANYDQHRFIKHEYTMTAEAWLPLPVRIVPTVLGVVASTRDYNNTNLGYLSTHPSLFG